MGLFNKLKNEFIDIIEWVDASSDTIVWKFPRYQNEIKMNAKLTVRESQVAIFLNEGKIVSTVGPYGKVNELANSNKLSESSIVILVNERTASASEILACALKENNRAIVIGKKTFGKGLVQEIIKLPDDSALHVTIASYLTPNGKNINKIGLIPNEIIHDENKLLQRAEFILLNNAKTRIAAL